MTLIGTRFKAGITGLELSTYQIVDILETNKETGMYYPEPELLVLLVDPTTDKPTFKRMFTLRSEDYRRILNHPDCLLLEKQKTKARTCTYSSPTTIRKSAPSPRPILRKNH